MNATITGSFQSWGMLGRAGTLCILCYRLCYIIYHALLLSLHDIQPKQLNMSHYDTFYEYLFAVDFEELSLDVLHQARKDGLASFDRIWHAGMEPTKSTEAWQPKGCVCFPNNCMFFLLGAGVERVTNWQHSLQLLVFAESDAQHLVC